MPKKKPENELTPEEQFKLFREKAKELGIDEKDKPLERAIDHMTIPSGANSKAKQTD